MNTYLKFRLFMILFVVGKKKTKKTIKQEIGLWLKINECVLMDSRPKLHQFHVTNWVNLLVRQIKLKGIYASTAKLTWWIKKIQQQQQKSEKTWMCGAWPDITSDSLNNIYISVSFSFFFGICFGLVLSHFTF